MSNIQLFNYGANPIRTVLIDGEVWFVAKDVCDILELGNITEALRDLDNDEKGFFRITEGTSPKGGNPNMVIINEPAIYGLVFKSRKPEAKAFSRWVKHDVLPQIHQTGGYSPDKEQSIVPYIAMDGARMIFEIAGIKDNQLALALDKIYYSYTGRSALQIGQISLIAPTRNQLLTPTEIGKHFGVSGRRINEILIEMEYQTKTECGYEALKLGEPYAVMLDTNKWHSDGTPIRQLKWDSSILDELDGLFANSLVF